MTVSSRDTVYQGRVTLVQPERGFRAGFDSLALAAALPKLASGEALELGCGCGGALFPAAFRLPEMRFTGIERDPDVAALAGEGIVLNRFADRVRVIAQDASDWVQGHENQFDLVFANPPYFEPGKVSPPGEGKSNAYIESLTLDGWVKAMVHAAKPRAPVILIHRAAELARLLAQMDRQTGDIHVLPIASKANEPARRILVRGRKGLKRGPVTLLPPLVTHDEAGARTPQAQAIAEAFGIGW